MKLAASNWQIKYLSLLIALIAIAQCGLSLYLPSLPAIASNFKIPAAVAQLTITYYAIGIGISQLFYGPLSDVYGRKNIILIGMGIFLLGTLIVLIAAKVDLLLWGRLIQGAGIGVATTITRAILRDIFQGNAYIKAGSKLASVVAITPIVAPIMGGYIQIYFGWHANFVVLLLLASITFVYWWYFFEETNSYMGQERLNAVFIIKKYFSIAKSAVFLKNALCGGLIYAGEVAILAMSPFLIQVKLGISSSEYGWLLFLSISGFIIGSRLSASLAAKLNSDKLVLIGISCSSFASITMLVCGMIDYFNLFSVILPLALFMLGAGLVYPNTAVMAVGNFSKEAGTASALLSCIQGLLAALTGIFISFSRNTSFLSMAGILVILCLLNWFFYKPFKTRSMVSSN